MTDRPTNRPTDGHHGSKGIYTSNNATNDNAWRTKKSQGNVAKMHKQLMIEAQTNPPDC